MNFRVWKGKIGSARVEHISIESALTPHSFSSKVEHKVAIYDQKHVILRRGMEKLGPREWSIKGRFCYLNTDLNAGNYARTRFFLSAP